jgi:hypothetical protein
MDDVDHEIAHVFRIRTGGREPSTIAIDVCKRWLPYSVNEAFIRAEELFFVGEASYLSGLFVSDDIHEKLALVPAYSSESDNDTLLRLIGSLTVKNGQDVNYCSKIIRKFLAAEDIGEVAAERVISEMFKQRWGSKKYTALEFQRIFEALTDENGTFITMIISERGAKKICDDDEHGPLQSAMCTIVDLLDRSPFPNKGAKWLINGIFKPKKINGETRITLPLENNTFTESKSAFNALIPLNYSIIIHSAE